MSTQLASQPDHAAPLIPPRKPKRAGVFPLWCKRTTTGLVVDKARVTFDEYQSAFQAAEDSDRGHQWWIGDLLVAGETLLPEEYAQVIDPDEEEKRADNGETYEIYRQVASRIPQPRRRGSLYFGHHQAVAYLKSAEEQDHWLDVAEGERLSVHKLRQRMKKAANGGAEDDPPVDLQVLQMPEVRQWLDDYRAFISTHDDRMPEMPGARFLHRMMRSHIDQVVRQLDRTVNRDCAVIKKAVSFEVAPTLQTIEHSMRIRGYFMSTADLIDRLDLLIELGQVRKQRAEAQRHEETGQRGDVPWEYKIVRNADEDEDVLW